MTDSTVKSPYKTLAARVRRLMVDDRVWDPIVLILLLLALMAFWL